MKPGQIRRKAVAVGRHEAPTPKSLPAFIERWAGAYGRVRRGEASIVALAEERYKALLQAADEHRRGDLDSRGKLTQSGLIDWINYALDVSAPGSRR